MTILYADDDKEDQEVFAEIIEAIDPTITILFAQNGIRTMEILASCDVPDIVFLDVNMPFLNGYQALAEIRKNDKFDKTRVIVYSTNGYQRIHEDYGALNAEYVRKPNTIGEGIQTLKNILQTG
jgi:CheY-like chemotaxis protein